MSKIIKRIDPNSKVSVKEFVPINLKPEQVISDELSPLEILKLQSQLKKSPIEQSLDRTLREISREYEKDINKPEFDPESEEEDHSSQNQIMQDLMDSAEKRRNTFIDNLESSKIKIETKVRNQSYKDK